MLSIKNIPALSDNYIWLIQNDQHHCVVVDPSTAQPVLDYLEQHHLMLDAILITHHHNDHTAGIDQLLEYYPHIAVIGPKRESIAKLTNAVEEGDQLELLHKTVTILDLPGHTIGHLGYMIDEHLFCGDVLFSAGCGRVMEGTYQQMFDSLNKISQLADHTRIYCAHEYTASNLAFAITVDPENKQLQQYRHHVMQLRSQNQATVPTTLKLEKQINPFLRCHENSIVTSISVNNDGIKQNTTEINKGVECIESNRNDSLYSDALAVFIALRNCKNNFQ